MYINSISKPAVKPWKIVREDFVIEKDDKLGHGLSKKKPHTYIERTK